jgi:hypothetical protein
MTLRAAALAMLAFCAPAHAADRLYRLDPATWTLYSVNGVTVTRLPSTVLAPDDSKVHPFLVTGTGRGDVGPPGYDKGRNYQTGLHVAPGGLDEFSVFYQWISGGHAAHLCVDGNITGEAAHQCLDYDGATGIATSASPAIVAYSIAQIGTAGWWRVSITFRTAAKYEYGDQAFPYVQHAPGTFALWRGFLVTGRAP